MIELRYMLNKIKNNLKNEIKSSKSCDSWFYEEHLLVVEEIALKLCKLYPEANKDIVLLNVWFHDIGRAHGHNKDHELYGANYAKKILEKEKFDEDFIKIVVNSCKTHSCSKNGKPENLEGKILATADALSHYHNGFYLRILYSWSKKKDVGFHELKEKLYKKMNRDLNEKIFFEEIKKTVKPMYNSWKKIAEKIKI